MLFFGKCFGRLFSEAIRLFKCRLQVKDMTEQKYEDLYYTVSDGLTLYARDYSGPSEDSSVCLCLPGVTRNSRDFELIAPILARTHRVIVVEQRGCGKSEYDSKKERYRPEIYINDMLQLLAQQNIEQCAVIGTSLGGLMAMGIATEKPTVFTHVVLNDIGPVIAKNGINRLKESVAADRAFKLIDWDSAIAYVRELCATVYPGYSRKDWRVLAERIFIEKNGKVVLDHDSGAANIVVSREVVAAIQDDLWLFFDALRSKPLMLVRGAITDLLDIETVEEMRRRHLTMEYLEVPNVGHAPTLDEPGVAQLIVNFINKS